MIYKCVFPFGLEEYLCQKSRDKGIMGGMTLVENQLFPIYLFGGQWAFMCYAAVLSHPPD